MTAVIVVVEFVPVTGKARELREGLVASIPAVHAEEGCERYSIQADEDGRITMIEKWTTAELLDQHSASPAVEALNRRLDGLLASTPIVQRLEPIAAGTSEQGVL